jgi:predicted transcriptional regulator
MEANWTAIPSIIIEKQEALGLNAIDMNIILHLSSYWWYADNLPSPSVETIAKAVGIQKRTVQKHIKTLEDIGLIKRLERRNTPTGSSTNQYSFEGLIRAALPFAKEKIAAKQEREMAEQERLKRKKPRLSVVEGGAS